MSNLVDFRISLQLFKVVQLQFHSTVSLSSAHKASSSSSSQKKTIFLCLRPKQMFSGHTVPCTLSKRFDGSQRTCICNNPCCYLQVHPLFDKAESKNKLLRSVAGGGVEQISQLQARWDKFEMMMESHELMVKEQVGKTQE